MCLILFAIDQHPDLPLVVAANRDEFYDRPTRAMHWWPSPDILAGQDKQSGGTWLAVTRSGNVAAVTNFRDGQPGKGAWSRGQLPLWALTAEQAELERRLGESQHQFAGYNLVWATSADGWYYSNRDSHPGRGLHRGTYGLSNHLLQSPWPKLVRLRKTLTQLMHEAPAEELHESLTQALMDTSPAPDTYLPDTGVGLETERFLSSPFIRSDTYGTRATTIVSVHGDGRVNVTEQAWLREGATGERVSFSWNRLQE
ncbi:NRDE family protein [Marinobacter nanhaiticus D15-8W]|uniref:NRDE family protein n=1 Tax=Marinobacter nanhaiticus D15-8W TaxID=626887 RepID=N6X076_9GAMM|nr:NRDE family protein [Marinobacter nanhaiticus]ENO16842.1 NRDE family protein [Marinobacter nanhaiticus D15-8W]